MSAAEKPISAASGRGVSREVLDYLKRRITILPTYGDVCGAAADEPALDAIIRRYPVTEWLSFLSRIQTMLAGPRINDLESRKRVFWGTLGPKVRAAIDAYSTKMAKQGATVGLFYERQLAMLQQYAILRAPETGEAKLETDKGKDDLGYALLMIADLMTQRGVDESDPGHNLECRIHDQTRMSLQPIPVYAGRAFEFYKLASNPPDSAVGQYLSLFETATGVNARDFILGGLAIAIHEEMRLADGQYEGWSTVPAPEKCPNPREADCIRAYLTARCKPVEDIRRLIERLDASKPLTDWNLIALSAAPIADLGETGRFTLNLTALGRSLFDGVRHTILTAALEKRLPDPWNAPAAIGGLYGEVFEQFAQGSLETAFPSRVHRIERGADERADFVIASGDKVMVVEVKAEHFVALDHARFMTLDERRTEIENVGIPKAIRQIAATIGALRAGEIDIGLSLDWTTTPIVPVIVTEERLPQVQGCWEPLYAPLMQPLHDLNGAGPIADLRVLSIDDLEIVPDIEAADDFATICWKWASDPDLKDSMLPAYLSANDIQWGHGYEFDRFLRMVAFLAERLGLDASGILSHAADMGQSDGGQES